MGNPHFRTTPEISSLAPEFVVELRSASDDLKPLQDKMQEYLDNGVRLGWLIDPQNQQVEIYLQRRQVGVLQSPTVLPGRMCCLGLCWI